MLRLAIILIALAVPCVVSAQPAEPPASLHWKNTSVFRWNPLGLVTAGELEYRHRLYPSDHPIFEQNYVGLAATPLLTPAFTRIGARVEVMPFAAARFGIHYEYVRFFGLFDMVQSFDDPSDAADDETLAANGADHAHYATDGTQLSLTGLLQAKLGPVAARNKFLLARVDVAVSDGDTVFYDSIHDLLLPAQGWFWTNELDLLYVGDRFISGLRWTALRSYLPGADGHEDPNSPIHRVGPLILHRLMGDDEGLVHKVSALGLFQWYVAHRYRAGQTSSRLIPYLAIGVIVEGRIF